MANEINTAELTRKLSKRDENGNLSSSNYVSEDEAREMAEKYGIPYIDLAKVNIDNELFRNIPVDLMYRYNFVPLQENDGVLTVVVSDPSDVVMIDELETLLNKPLDTAVGSTKAIQDILKKSESSQRVLDEVTEGFKLNVVNEGMETDDESLSIDKLTADTSPVIKLVDSTIFNALQRRVSDIHMETRDDKFIIKYRIDGVLYQAMEPIDKRYANAVISRIKVMSELDIAENRRPQDGRFKIKLKGKSIDFRVSIMPCVHGEDAVLRILDKESANEQFSNLNLTVLGFEERILKRLRKFISEPYGMVLVTGPTGSGKTTTLYGALQEVKTSEDKLITIEDPVEYQVDGITQIPVNEKKGLTFARGLRSILRHDPDKIMVGEIRDSETAEIAIQSALTGHLVFTTVHANNVVDVLGRFLNMGIEPYNFVSALNCVLAQRLVRKICNSCRHEVQISEAELRESAITPELYKGVTFYEGKGCIDCNGTGFRGRTAIAELLELSDAVRTMLIDKRPSSEIKKVARKEGMKFLREAAVEKFLKGETTIKEINKVTFIE